MSQLDSLAADGELISVPLPRTLSLRPRWRLRPPLEPLTDHRVTAACATLDTAAQSREREAAMRSPVVPGRDHGRGATIDRGDRRTAEALSER